MSQDGNGSAYFLFLAFSLVPNSSHSESDREIRMSYIPACVCACVAINLQEMVVIVK